MKSLRPALLPLLAACTLLATSCAGPQGLVGPTRKGAQAPPAGAQGAPELNQAAIAQRGATVTLTGKVKIVIDAGAHGASGVISNNGGTILSESGAGIVSDNGAGLVANNGGSVISNNGSTLTAKARYALNATATPREYDLADAVITFTSADGTPILDESGKPLTATTDKSGAYKLSAVLPAQSLVLRIKLWQGGELSALLPKTTLTQREQPIDTATTLGAAYVLNKYVQGKQATLDKLPAAAAEKLRMNLDAARSLVTSVPTYKSQELVSLAESLKSKAPAVANALDEIKGLLLGQTHLGDGRIATSVRLYEPRTLTLDDSGNLLVGEPLYGRIRQIAPDGTLSTYADAVRGRIARNFPRMRSVVRAADGTVYVAADHQVARIRPNGQIDVAAGVANNVTPGTQSSPTSDNLVPARLALGPDGTLYIGETHHEAVSTQPPRVLALTPDGKLDVVPVAGAWAVDGSVAGLAVGPEGSLDVMYTPTDGPSTLVHYQPGVGTQTIATDLQNFPGNGGIARAPNGTLYVCESVAGRVTAFMPDGRRQVVAGKGGPAITSDLGLPNAITVAPDGTIYVSDGDKGLVHALTAAGDWSLKAGTAAPVGSNLGDLSLDAPQGLAFDNQDRLLVSERGSHRVARFDGSTLTNIAGSRAGFSGDGGPATAARIAYPGPLAYFKGETYFADAGNQRLRKISLDGTISTLVSSGEGMNRVLQRGERVDASKFPVNASAVAVSPDGQLYWACQFSHQVCRLAADGQVELVCGQPAPPSPGADFLSQYLKIGTAQEATGPAQDATLSAPFGLAFDAGGNLYVADVGTLLVRKISGLKTNSPTISRYAGTSSLAALAGAEQNDNVLRLPSAIAFDAQGALYIAEIGTVAVPYFIALTDAGISSLTTQFPATNARIRKLLPDGSLSVVAGPGSRLFGDPKADDGLLMPSALAFAADGRLAIADAGSNQLHVLPAGSY